jgi:hypothetical protein
VVVRHSTIVGPGFGSGGSGSSGGQPSAQQQAGGLQLDTDEDEETGRDAYAAAQAAAAAAAAASALASTGGQAPHAAGAGSAPMFVIPGIKLRRAHRLLPRCKVLRVVNVTQPRHGRAFAVPAPAAHALPCLLTGQSMSDADIRYLRDPVTGDIRIPTLPDGALQKAMLTGQCVGPWASNALHSSTTLFHLAADALTPTAILYIAAGVPPGGLPAARNVSNSGAAAGAAAAGGEASATAAVVATGPAAWFATADSFKYQVTDGLGPAGAAGTGLVKVTFPNPKAAAVPATPDAGNAGVHADAANAAADRGADPVPRPPQPQWSWCTVPERDALTGVDISPLSALAAAPLPWGCVTTPHGKATGCVAASHGKVGAGAGCKADSKSRTTVSNDGEDDAAAPDDEGVASLAASIFRLLQGDLADCLQPTGPAQRSGCSLRLSAIYGGGSNAVVEPLPVQRTGLAGRLRLLADGGFPATQANDSIASPAAVESARMAADGSLTQLDSSSAPRLSPAPEDCLFLMGSGPVQCLHNAGAEGALRASSARQPDAQRATQALQLLLLREHNAVASELVAALLRHYHDSIVPAAVGPEPPAFSFSDPSARFAPSGHAFQMEAGQLQQPTTTRARAAARSAADRARAEAVRRYRQAVMRLLHPTGPPTAAYALSPAAKAQLLRYASTLLRWVEREEGGVDADASDVNGCGNEGGSGSAMDGAALSWFRRHEWIAAVSPHRNVSAGALPPLPNNPPVLLPLPGLSADVEGVPYPMPAAYPYAYDGGVEAARAYDRLVYETARSLVLARWRALVVGEWQAVVEAALLGDARGGVDTLADASDPHGASASGQGVLMGGGGAALPSRGGLLDGSLAHQLRREGSGALQGRLSGAETQLRAVLDSVRALQSTAQLPLQHKLLRAVGALP